jgi:predicted transcriptional regulator
MLQLDSAAREKLQALADHFAISQAAVMRQLIAQAQPKAFPEGWQRAVAER